MNYLSSHLSVSLSSGFSPSFVYESFALLSVFESSFKCACLFCVYAYYPYFTIQTNQIAVFNI